MPQLCWFIFLFPRKNNTSLTWAASHRGQPLTYAERRGSSSPDSSQNTHSWNWHFQLWRSGLQRNRGTDYSSYCSPEVSHPSRLFNLFRHNIHSNGPRFSLRLLLCLSIGATQNVNIGCCHQCNQRVSYPVLLTKQMFCSILFYSILFYSILFYSCVNV